MNSAKLNGLFSTGHFTDLGLKPRILLVYTECLIKIKHDCFRDIISILLTSCQQTAQTLVKSQCQVTSVVDHVLPASAVRKVWANDCMGTHL